MNNYDILKSAFHSNFITQNDVYEQVLATKISIEDYKSITGDLEVEVPLETLKQNKINEINKKCNDEILAGFTSSIKNGEQHYDFDYESQINYLGLFTAVTVGGVTEIEWKNSDQLICEIWSANEFLQLYNEAMSYKTARIKKCHELRVLVDNCETVEEVEAISWDTEIL